MTERSGRDALGGAGRDERHDERVIKTPLTRWFDLSTPIIGAPMAGVAGGELARAVSLGGGLGMIGVSGATSAEFLTEQCAIPAERRGAVRRGAHDLGARRPARPVRRDRRRAARPGVGLVRRPGALDRPAARRRDRRRGPGQHHRRRPPGAGRRGRRDRRAGHRGRRAHREAGDPAAAAGGAHPHRPAGGGGRRHRHGRRHGGRPRRGRRGRVDRDAAARLPRGAELPRRPGARAGRRGRRHRADPRVRRRPAAGLARAVARPGAGQRLQPGVARPGERAGPRPGGLPPGDRGAAGPTTSTRRRSTRASRSGWSRASARRPTSSGSWTPPPRRRCGRCPACSARRRSCRPRSPRRRAR